MHPMYTPIYLVGKGQVLSIDSGESMERYRWMLRGYLAAIEKDEVALSAITHHHLDHTGNLKWLDSELGAEVMVPGKSVKLLKGKLPSQRTTLDSGDSVIELDGGVRVQVLETPGHSTDSVCYYIESEGVLFSGDTILGTGTTTVSNLKDYRATLQRLLEIPNLKVMAPGHGPLIHDPKERIREYIAHRDMRERQIIEVLGRGGAWSSWDIMLELYPDIDKRLRSAANNNVVRHLEQLEAEGRLNTYAGKPRRASEAKRRREQEREIEHARVRKLAAKYEKEDRRRELAQQENPPTAQWAEPPRFELIGTPNE
jgi:glyoxylase-like metal-dependent hydrolase (beta-lactamase superfamily II)